MQDPIITTSEPSGRIAMWLQVNPGRHLDRSAVAGRLQIAIGAVDPQLSPGVEAGLLTIFTDGELGRCWRAGPLLANWPVAGALRATPPPAKPVVAAKPRKERQSLAPLDPTKLGTVTGPPPSSKISKNGITKHDALFDSLTADNMGKTGIPKAYIGALLKAAQVYLKRHPALKLTSLLLVRSMGDGQHCGVWRVPRGPAAVADPTPRQRAA